MRILIRPCRRMYRELIENARSARPQANLGTHRQPSSKKAKTTKPDVPAGTNNLFHYHPEEEFLEQVRTNGLVILLSKLTPIVISRRFTPIRSSSRPRSRETKSRLVSNRREGCRSTMRARCRPRSRSWKTLSREGGSQTQTVSFTHLCGYECRPLGDVVRPIPDAIVDQVDVIVRSDPSKEMGA